MVNALSRGESTADAGPLRTAVIPALMKEREYLILPVPRLMKVVINMGVGEGKGERQVIDFATADLEAIAGREARGDARGNRS